MSILTLYIASSILTANPAAHSLEGFAVPQPILLEWAAPVLESIPHRAGSEGPGGWSIEWLAEQRPGGVGHSSKEMGDIAQRRLMLYQLESQGSHRAHTEATIKRAVAYTIFFLFDEKHQWSEEHEWRSINGWRDALASYATPWPHAANLLRPAYILHEDADSARHDFASFMAWYITVPIPTGTDSPLCNYLSQNQVATKALGEVAVELPLRLRNPEEVCRRFRDWAKLDAIESIELNYAIPGTKNATSSFGHLFLRVIYQESLGYHPMGHSRVLTYWARTDPRNEGSLLYTLGGLFGAYRAALFSEPFSGTYESYVVEEERDISRWRLNIDPAEEQRLLERIWTSHKTAEYSYFFLQQNCATLLIDLINSSLPGDRILGHTGIMGRSPAQGLDALYATRLSGARPLLIHLPERILSMRTAAIKSITALEAIEAQLEKKISEHDKSVFEQIRGGDDGKRKQGYEELEKILAPLTNTDPNLLNAYFLHRGVIESHLNARHNELQTEKLKEKHFRALSQLEVELPTQIRASLTTHIANLQPDEATALEAEVIAILSDIAADNEPTRYAAYASLLAYVEEPNANRELATMLRCIALLNALKMGDDDKGADGPLIRALFFPRADRALNDQPYLEKYRQFLEMPYSTEVSEPILALQATKSALRAQHDGSLPVTTNTDFIRESQIEKEREAYERSYSHSGIDQFGIELGAHSLSSSTKALQLGVRGALYHEGLGEWSRHGLRGLRELTVMAASSWWSWTDDRPRIQRSHLRLLGYRHMLPAALQEGASRLGWEIYSDFEFRPWKHIKERMLIGTGGMLKIFGTPHLLHHVIATGGLNLEVRHEEDPSSEEQLGMGFPLGIEGRLSLLPQTRTYDAISWSAVVIPFWDATSGKTSAGWRVEINYLYALSDSLRGLIDLPPGIGARLSFQASQGTLDTARETPTVYAAMGLQFH